MPLESETNHQETGPRLQESGLAVQTAQNHSIPHHLGVFHLKQWSHFPGMAPISF